MCEASHRKCRDCTKPFTISAKEMTWLKEKELEPFTRCVECRRKNKKSKTVKTEIDKLVNDCDEYFNNICEKQVRAEHVEAWDAYEMGSRYLQTIQHNLAKLKEVV